MANATPTPEQRAETAAKGAENALTVALEHEKKARDALSKITCYREEARVGKMAWASLIATIATAIAATVAVWVACSQLSQIRTDARIALMAEMSAGVLSALHSFAENEAVRGAFNDGPESVPYDVNRDLTKLVTELLRASRFARQASDPHIFGELQKIVDATCAYFSLGPLDGVFEFIAHRQLLGGSPTEGASDRRAGNESEEDLQRRLDECRTS